MSWTIERMDRLELLWKSGKSATQIAKLMSTSAKPLSRSAVLAKLNRLGLLKTDRNFSTRTAVAKKPAAAKAAVQKEKPPKLKVAPAPRTVTGKPKVTAVVVPVAGPAAPTPIEPRGARELGAGARALDIVQRSKGCLFGIGHPPDAGFHFCGEPRAPQDDAYCAPHRKRCTHVITLRRADAA